MKGSHSESGLGCDELVVRFGATTALHRVTLRVGGGEMIAVTGPSGSGKSTLLRCLAGLQRPDAGAVWFQGRDLVTLTDAQRAEVRRRSFGFVFQFSELLPELTLAENVGLPLELNHVRSTTRRNRVEELAERLDIADLMARRPGEVSGGQAQRAAVARALAHRPSVVFADEPTGALDSVNGSLVLTALSALARDEGASVLLVTHEDRRAQVADRQVMVVDGRLHPVACA